ncbi:MAG TPA: outer membrane lipoprotein carrier protein LolA [Gemmatimonadaceae bacterium]|jgi:Outer membrane lipoprotein-sorting protein|nr:outer membrane lipoprotein carrier protein LolA [Gemmatimonadaceae bacterium]
MSVLTLLLVATLQSPADKAIDAAVVAYAGIRTAKATFEQTITNPLLGSELKSRGEFEQSRPNRFAFRFTDPKGDVIVCDGRYVWAYLPTSTPGRVNRAPCGGDQAGSLDLIGEFFTSPKDRYTIGDGGAATIGDRKTHVVLLTPRSKNAAFTRAKVWIEPTSGSLVQFEAVEPSGLTRLVRITRFTPNAPVNQGAFTFTVPKGVKVVDIK